MLRRIWVTVGDDKTREAHRLADGQEVGADEPFRVDGEELFLPSDPSGSPENTFSCRCKVRYREVGKRDAELAAVEQRLRDRYNIVFAPERSDDPKVQTHYDRMNGQLHGRYGIKDKVKLAKLIEETNADLAALGFTDLFVNDQLQIVPRHTDKRRDKTLTGGVTSALPQTELPLLVAVELRVEQFHIDGARSIDKGANAPQTAFAYERRGGRRAFLKYNTRHEIGHTIVRQPGVPEAFQKLYNAELVAPDPDRPNKKISVWFRDNLSAYAAVRPREAFAEAFAWYTSPDYPRDVPHSKAKNRLPVELEQAIEDALAN